MGKELKINNYTYQDYLNAVFDVDYLLSKEPVLIVEVTRLLANFTLMSSGNNKLTVATQNKLEMLVSYVFLYSFLVQSIKNAEDFLTSPALDETVLKILSSHPKELLDGTSGVCEEYFYLLRNNCLRIVAEPQFSTYTVLIGNLIKTKRFNEPNYIRGIVHTALFIEKNLLKQSLPQYPFRFMQQ